MRYQDPIYFAPQRKLGGGWLLFKSSPSPPPAPDYAGAASATASGNLQAAQQALRNAQQAPALPETVDVEFTEVETSSDLDDLA